MPSDGRDRPTDDVATRVVERQRGACLARVLDPYSDDCRGRLHLDHVRDVPQVGAPIVKRGPARRRRYRAPSDEAHLVAVCGHHHLDGWATSHRPEIRRWLASET